MQYYGAVIGDYSSSPYNYNNPNSYNYLNKFKKGLNNVYNFVNPTYAYPVTDIDQLGALGVLNYMRKNNQLSQGQSFKLGNQLLTYNGSKFISSPLKGIDKLSYNLNNTVSNLMPLANLFATGYGIYSSIKQNNLAEQAFRDNQKTSELQRESIQENLKAFREEYDRTKRNRLALSQAYGR